MVPILGITKSITRSALPIHALSAIGSDVLPCSPKDQYEMKGRRFLHNSSLNKHLLALYLLLKDNRVIFSQYVKQRAANF